MMLFIFVYTLILYLLLFFFFSRLIIPHLGFREERIPAALPADMAEKINELKAQACSAGDFLRLSYDYLGSKFHSERLNTILKFHYLFLSPAQAWRLNGYLPCTVNNYLLKIFLIKSGYFKASEVRRRHVFVNFIMHQYLQVKLYGVWLDVDVGDRHYGLPLGKHLKWFG